MRLGVLGIILIGWCGTATVSADDLDLLAGSWRATNTGPRKDATVLFRVEKAGSFQMTVLTPEGAEVVVKGDLGVVDSTTPKEVNLTKVSATVGGKSKSLPDRYGIYALDGDTLTLRAGSTRPAELTGAEAEKDPGWLKLTREKTTTDAKT